MARQRVELETVSPAAWRGACAAALEAGERFAGAFAGGPESERVWSAMFARESEIRVIRTAVAESVDSIVDLVPAADWDEREAHDCYGLRFAGHEPLRPLLDHDPDLASWTVPVHGDGVHQVAVGPVHAGVIESGHFRFHVVGERILALDPRLFYKHRGLEIAVEGSPLGEGLAFAQRACGACAVTNSVAYAQACEMLQGLAPTRAVRKARTVLLELERLYNHLNDIAAVCAGVGFASGNMVFAALKERALRLNREVGGHRFLFGTVHVAHNEIELAGSDLHRARAALRELHVDAAAAWRELEFAASLQARLDGVGRLAADDAVRLGAVGPAARASGIREDVRAHSPALWYSTSFAPARVDEPAGDVAARLRIRAAELEQTFALLDDLLADPLESASAGWAGAVHRLAVARVESPRGETVCVVEAGRDVVRRLHLRTGSYANWPALAHATAGELLPDFPLINKSFELCYACADR